MIWAELFIRFLTEGKNRVIETKMGFYSENETPFFNSRLNVVFLQDLFHINPHGSTDRPKV
jgi:hypothetical protein